MILADTEIYHILKMLLEHLESIDMVEYKSIGKIDASDKDHVYVLKCIKRDMDDLKDILKWRLWQLKTEKDIVSGELAENDVVQTIDGSIYHFQGVSDGYFNVYPNGKSKYTCPKNECLLSRSCIKKLSKEEIEQLLRR
ncbi:MAG: hypothetical protein GXO10_04980 [Crenarchaeota archaeon]|nr:hypothetical protein [Thermoproteota archaeon]